MTAKESQGKFPKMLEFIRSVYRSQYLESATGEFLDNVAGSVIIQERKDDDEKG